MTGESTSSTRTESLLEQKESAAWRGQRLSAVPSDLLTLRNVVRVDLSRNELTRVPGSLVASELPRVEVLLLQDNLLFEFEDVLALSKAPRLRELDVRRNPLRMQNNRVYLLEALLGAQGCSGELLLMDFHDLALKHADEDASRASGRRMEYRAKLPRRHGFPMLLKLNDEWVTDSEVEDVEAERGSPIEYFRPTKPQRVDAKTVKETDSRTKLMMMMVMSTERNGAEKQGKPLDRHFDGSRMTMRQIAASNARETTIPAPQLPQHFQIDVSTGNVVDVDVEDDDDRAVDAGSASEYSHPVDMDGDPEEVAVLRQIFRPSVQSVETRADLASYAPFSPAQAPRDSREHKPCREEQDDVEPWNYPVSTFDTLGSEDRHYVRAKSKQTGEMLERDDHFFASAPFVDCVVQCERSRRLTVRAVDLLSPPIEPSVATRLSEVATSERAAALADTLNAKFSREKERETFERVMAFQKKRVVVNGETKIQSSVADLFLAEHMDQHLSTTQLLLHTPHTSSKSATSLTSNRSSKQAVKKSQGRGKGGRGHQHHEAGPADAASIEASLSKTKLQNAVDLVSPLVDHKQQRRMIQALIDADAKVIEEERVTLDQATHCHRLERIRQGQRPDDSTGVHQAVPRGHSLTRNWRAKQERDKQQQQQQQQTRSSSSRSTSRDTEKAGASDGLDRANHLSSTCDRGVQRPLSASASTPAFRHITTVDKATLDPLAAVSSHELLVRCADIRQRVGRHMRGLTAYRDRFLDDESEWERMRHDPTNVVRRHLHRRLFRDAPQVQIGATQYFFSPLFK